MGCGEGTCSSSTPCPKSPQTALSTPVIGVGNAKGRKSFRHIKSGGGHLAEWQAAKTDKGKKIVRRIVRKVTFKKKQTIRVL
jgi:hypothetical protein